MSFARMRKLLCLVCLATVGWLSYPLAAWLHPRFLEIGNALLAEIGVEAAALLASRSAAPAPGDLLFAAAFFVALLGVCFALRSRLPDVTFGGARAWLRATVLITAGSCAVWLGLLFALSALASLDRIFVGTLFFTALALLLALRLFLLSIFWRPGRVIVGGAAAVAVVAYGLSGAPKLDRAILLVVMTLSMLVGFFVLGGTLARRGFSPLKRLLASVVAGHALFLTVAFFLGMIDLLPRGLLTASLLAGLILGAAVLVVEGLLGFGGRGAFLYHPDQAARPEAWATLARPATVSVPGKVTWILQRSEESLERLHFLAGALSDAGRQVVIFVPPTQLHRVRPGPWAVVTLPKTLPFRVRTTVLLALLRGIIRAASFIAPDRSKRLAYAGRTQVLHDRVSLKRFAGEHEELRPSVVVSTDWEVAPAALSLARAVGAKFVYDISELETDQYFNDARWVENEAPVARSVAAASQAKADVATVASTALRRAVGERTPADRKLVLVRSAPAIAKAPLFKPTKAPLRLLYNGDIIGSQGLEALVDGMQKLRERYRLTLRGQADHGFLGDLKRRIAKLGLEQCIELDIVDRQEAGPDRTAADIGIVIWVGESPKLAYSVPQQLAMHVHTGRCVLLVGAGEAADMVREFGIGVVVPGATAQDLVASLEPLESEKVDTCKRAAIVASAKWNQSHEGRALAAAL